MADLQHQGVPIEGEAGVGYRLGSGFDLPPLMFTEDEARARAAAESQTVYAPLNVMTGLDAPTRQRLQDLREAVQAQRKVHITYLDPQNKTSQRTLRPLGCFYWGKVWTLAAWCEVGVTFAVFGWTVFKVAKCWRRASNTRQEKC